MISAAILCISIATDYWLLTSEPYDIASIVAMSGMGGGAGGEGEIDSVNEEVEKEYEENTTDLSEEEDSVGPSGPMSSLVMIHTHSGLWQICVSTDTGSGAGKIII